MAQKYYSATVRPSWNGLAMTDSFSPQPHYPRKLERLPQSPVRPMPHQQDGTQLGQHINQIISNVADPDALLQRVAQVLGKDFQADCCLVGVMDGNTATVGTANWVFDKNDAVPLQHQKLLLEKLASSMAVGVDLLIVDDIQVDETSFLKRWQPVPLLVRAVLGVTTHFQGQPNGAIILVRCQPYHWTELEIERLQESAALVAIAISQVVQTRLIASLQQQLHASRQYQSLSNRLIMASRGSLDLDQFLKLAIAGTAQTLQVKRGLILMLKYADPLFKHRERREQIPKAKVTVVCEWHNDYQALGGGEDLNSSELESYQQQSSVLNQSFWISECLLCQQALTNSPVPVVVADPHKLPDINPTTDIAPLFNFPCLPAILLFPLESQGTVLGLLVLQHSSPRLFTEEELALLEKITAQVSTAIIQNQTLRQVQSLVEERTAQLQRSLEVQVKLYEKTRQQIDQMRQLNQVKDEFLSTMSHELRTPLTSMSLAIRMLRHPGLSTDRYARYLEILEEQCNQEINLVNDLLTLQELETHQVPLNLETIDLKPRVLSLSQLFQKKWADKGLTITVNLPEAPLLLETDPDSLDRILQELLTNAGKYSHPDTVVVLEATHQVNQQINQIVLTLTNYGDGIPAADITYIFDKFRRGQGVTQQAIQGTGLGLALVKCLVQHLNGTIDVSSDPDSCSSMNATCFTLTLPLFFDHIKL